MNPIKENVPLFKWALLMLAVYGLYVFDSSQDHYRFFFRSNFIIYRGNTHTGELEIGDWEQGRWIEVCEHQRIDRESIAPKKNTKKNSPKSQDIIDFSDEFTPYDPSGG